MENRWFYLSKDTHAIVEAEKVANMPIIVNTSLPEETCAMEISKLADLMFSGAYTPGNLCVIYPVKHKGYVVHSLYGAENTMCGSSLSLDIEFWAMHPSLRAVYGYNFDESGKPVVQELIFPVEWYEASDKKYTRGEHKAFVEEEILSVLDT